MTWIHGRETAGRITGFDDARGLGEVSGDDGAVYPFHCIEIADGSRDIAVGTTVRFVPRPKLGRTEATAIVAVEPPSGS